MASFFRSIADKLGIPLPESVSPGKNVDGVVEMMLDATQNYSEALTEERLFGWHHLLFPTGRSGMVPITVADYRPESAGAMHVVSGKLGSEKVHFEAPAANRLPKEMMLNGFQGFMQTAKYAKIAKCSTDTALRDLKHLVAHGLLIQNDGGGKSTSYRLANREELKLFR